MIAPVATCPVVPSTTTETLIGTASTRRSRPGVSQKVTVQFMRRGRLGSLPSRIKGSASGPAPTWARSWVASVGEVTSVTSKTRTEGKGATGAVIVGVGMVLAGTTLVVRTSVIVTTVYMVIAEMVAVVRTIAIVAIPSVPVVWKGSIVQAIERLGLSEVGGRGNGGVVSIVSATIVIVGVLVVRPGSRGLTQSLRGQCQGRSIALADNIQATIGATLRQLPRARLVARVYVDAASVGWAHRPRPCTPGGQGSRLRKTSAVARFHNRMWQFWMRLRGHWLLGLDRLLRPNTCG